MTRLLQWAALAAVLAATACGGNKTTAPTATTPNYAGSWGGNYTISSCTQDGDFAAANLCGAIFPTGSVFPYSFLFAQTDRNVSGTFLLGSITFTFPATTITSDGGLTVTGSYTQPNDVVITPTWTLHMTTTQLSGTSSTTTLTGTIAQIWTATALGATGKMTASGSLTSATKFSSTTLTAPASLVPRSLKELTSALTTAQP